MQAHFSRALRWGSVPVPPACLPPAASGKRRDTSKSVFVQPLHKYPAPQIRPGQGNATPLPAALRWLLVAVSFWGSAHAKCANKFNMSSFVLLSLGPNLHAEELLDWAVIQAAVYSADDEWSDAIITLRCSSLFHNCPPYWHFAHCQALIRLRFIQ